MSGYWARKQQLTGSEGKDVCAPKDERKECSFGYWGRNQHRAGNGGDCVYHTAEVCGRSSTANAITLGESSFGYWGQQKQGAVKPVLAGKSCGYWGQKQSYATQDKCNREYLSNGESALHADTDSRDDSQKSSNTMNLKQAAFGHFGRQQGRMVDVDPGEEAFGYWGRKQHPDSVNDGDCSTVADDNHSGAHQAHPTDVASLGEHAFGNWGQHQGLTAKSQPQEQAFGYWGHRQHCPKGTEFSQNLEKGSKSIDAESSALACHSNSKDVKPCRRQMNLFMQPNVALMTLLAKHEATTSSTTQAERSECHTHAFPRLLGANAGISPEKKRLSTVEEGDSRDSNHFGQRERPYEGLPF